MKGVKFYLFGLFCLTLIALGVFILILFNVDPDKADILTTGTFFASLYIFFLGILTFIGFYIRIAKSNNEVFFGNFVPAFRQAALFALVIIGLLILQVLQVLNWWDGVMLALSILLFEMYFQAHPPKLQNLSNHR